MTRKFATLAATIAVAAPAAAAPAAHGMPYRKGQPVSVHIAKHFPHARCLSRAQRGSKVCRVHRLRAASWR